LILIHRHHGSSQPLEIALTVADRLQANPYRFFLTVAQIVFGVEALVELHLHVFQSEVCKLLFVEEPLGAIRNAFSEPQRAQLVSLEAILNQRVRLLADCLLKLEQMRPELSVYPTIYWYIVH